MFLFSQVSTAQFMPFQYFDEVQEKQVFEFVKKHWQEADNIEISLLESIFYLQLEPNLFLVGGEFGPFNGVKNINPTDFVILERETKETDQFSLNTSLDYKTYIVSDDLGYYVKQYREQCKLYSLWLVPSVYTHPNQDSEVPAGFVLNTDPEESLFTIPTAACFDAKESGSVINWFVK